VPRLTIIEPAPGDGRCSAFASSHGARIQQSCSCVVGITGIAFGYSHDTTIEVCATWSEFAPVRHRLTFSDVSNIEQRLRTRGCMVVFITALPRHLPVTESIVLPLWIREPAMRRTQLNQLRARKHRGNSKWSRATPQAARYRYAFSHSNLKIF
jgi:hypothetical protein